MAKPLPTERPIKLTCIRIDIDLWASFKAVCRQEKLSASVALNTMMARHVDASTLPLPPGVDIWLDLPATLKMRQETRLIERKETQQRRWDRTSARRKEERRIAREKRNTQKERLSREVGT